MPEEEKLKSSEKQVDLDTSGPEVDVVLEESKEEVVETAPETTTEEVVRKAYGIALSRTPSAVEMKQMTDFITDQAVSYGDADNSLNLAVIDYCQIMLCLNEFLFID